MWDKQGIRSLGNHAARAKEGHHFVDDGGTVQGEPKVCVDRAHLKGRSEYVRKMSSVGSRASERLTYSDKAC